MRLYLFPSEEKSVVLHMDFSEVIGQEHLKSHLKKTIENSRIPHAQLFIGKSGSGLLPMALGYVKEILCQGLEKKSAAYTNCASRIDQLSHPDLHFIYPVNTNDSIKKNPISDHFSSEWREFVLANPYGSLYDWYQHIGIENKQGNISKNEAEDFSKKLSLKAYEGGYKIVVIWMADKMNNECSNKILKIVEEPPEKTVLLLLTEEEEKMLTTIQSRCQKLHFPLLSEEQISNQLIDKQDVDINLAKKISHQAQGSYNKALHLLKQDGDDIRFEAWFISWVRTAFKAKGNKASINELLLWSENLAKEGRETQKKFLDFCEEVFRQALLKNYKADSLLFFESLDPTFSLKKFAPFVHQNNIFEISTAIEDAQYHIERNGNSKIIFSDLSIQLTRLIHRKSIA